MPSDTLFDITSELRALGGGRVWSLMVSLFGDLAQGRGDSIDGPVLSLIMTALGVKPEAARVALHRLRNDGWTASEKHGRISRHSLTAKGRAESVAASPRIYAKPYDAPEDWQVVLIQNADAKLQDAVVKAGMVQLMPRVFAGPKGITLPVGALALPGDAAPRWLCDQVAPTALLPEYEALQAALTTLKDRLETAPELTAIDIAVLRCLIVHNWRRLVLKHPALPSGLIAPGSPVTACHALVDAILARYPRPSLQAIALEQSK